MRKFIYEILIIPKAITHFIKNTRKNPLWNRSGLRVVEQLFADSFIHDFKICISFKMRILERNCGNQMLESSYIPISQVKLCHFLG
jgi:hypothetical protein